MSRVGAIQLPSIERCNTSTCAMSASRSSFDDAPAEAVALRELDIKTRWCAGGQAPHATESARRARRSFKFVGGDNACTRRHGSWRQQTANSLVRTGAPYRYAGVCTSSCLVAVALLLTCMPYMSSHINRGRAMQSLYHCTPNEGERGAGAS